jgi:hypothetical protein
MCGGTMKIDRRNNTATCLYCGNVSTILDMGENLYVQYQTMLDDLMNKTDTKEHLQEGFWVEAEEEEVERADGENIRIRYLAKCRADMCTMYVAKAHVIYLFEKQDLAYAQKYLKMPELLKFPNSSMEQELKRYLPQVATSCELKNGGMMIAVHKPEEVYPLVLFGTLLDRHAAWMVSRMENLCCLLEYNDLSLNALTLQNLFVNPAEHQLYLYGGWWFAGKQGTEYAGIAADASDSIHEYYQKRQECHITTDLETIRLNAAKLMGYADREAAAQDATIPEPFRKFIRAVCRKSAQEDFELWDRTLTASYGERKFIHLNVTREDIYSRE